jgi:hypothetical protein
MTLGWRDGRPPSLKALKCPASVPPTLQIETQPENTKVPWQLREKIARVTRMKLVFTDGGQKADG